MPYRIIVTDSVFPNLDKEKEILKGLGTVDLITWTNETELRKKASLADALLVQWAPISASFIEALHKCKIIVRYGIGVDNIDLKAAWRKRIPVCNVPDYCVDEVADHTITLAVASLRQLKEVDINIRKGIWKNDLPQPTPPFHELNFCVVGFGRIARKVSVKAIALGFTVCAYDPFIPASEIEKSGVLPMKLNKLLKEADVLSLHLPLNDKTKHFINASALEKMKPSALLVNTSRGGLINQKDLITSLSGNKLRGAALDVFEKEPLTVDSPLLNLPSIILSSHVAWYSSSSAQKLQKMAAEEIARGLRGEILSNQIMQKTV